MDGNSCSDCERGDVDGSISGMLSSPKYRAPFCGTVGVSTARFAYVIRIARSSRLHAAPLFQF